MANTKSAKKRAAKSALLREKNRATRSTMRTAVKKVRRATTAGDAKAAESALADAVRILDKTAQKGVVHKNTAARAKSRLAAAVRKLAQ